MEELAAMATRSGGDGEETEVGCGVGGSVVEEELFSVDGMMER